MPRATIEDPLKVFRFRIEIDGITRAGFTEATGLERETDVVEYREGGMNETPQKSAGLTKYPDLTFKRGQIIGSTRGGDDDFIKWAKQVHDVATQGNPGEYRRDFDVVQLSVVNTEARRWRVYNAFPRRLKPLSDMSGGSSDNSFEEMVIVHEGFDLVE